MNKTILIFVAITIVAAVSASHLATDMKASFEAFKAKYGKQYPTADEEARRFKIFQSNAVRARLASRPNGASHGVTKFSDLTPAEFRSTLRTRKPARLPSMPIEALANVQGIPTVLDWRKKGAVTPVQNQGQCGDSIAFGGAANLEGANFVVNDKLIAVSIAQLFACGAGGGGCSGTDVTLPEMYQWFIDHNGGNITSAAAFPMNSTNLTCRTKDLPVAARIKSVTMIPKDEQTMTKVVAVKGPIAVAVDATSWQTYTGGVMTNCKGNDINDEAAIVGYNDQAHPPYWIVKTSWGTSFGDSGYVLIQKGDNQCGITYQPVTVDAERI